MAYNAQKISPINFSPSVGVGVSLPLNGKSVFKSTFTTREAVKNNLINWFLTNNGERPLNPGFGGNLRRFIFEQINQGNLEFLQEDLQSQISTFFPSIVISNLDVLSYPDSNQIEVQILYSIKGTNSTDEINITFN
jgi:phage baseplate assembly protein W